MLINFPIRNIAIHQKKSIEYVPGVQKVSHVIDSLDENPFMVTRQIHSRVKQVKDSNIQTNISYSSLKFPWHLCWFTPLGCVICRHHGVKRDTAQRNQRVYIELIDLDARNSNWITFKSHVALSCTWRKFCITYLYVHLQQQNSQILISFQNKSAR